MSGAEIDDELWSAFQDAVNMSSGALGDWLRIISADPDWQDDPDPAGLWTGHRVLNILRKQRADLTEEDVAVMRTVVDDVRAERERGIDHGFGRAAWRRRLLSMGHDPLKAA